MALHYIHSEDECFNVCDQQKNCSSYTWAPSRPSALNQEKCILWLGLACDLYPDGLIWQDRGREWYDATSGYFDTWFFQRWAYRLWYFGAGLTCMDVPDDEAMKPKTCQFRQRLWVTGHWSPVFAIATHTKVKMKQETHKDIESSLSSNIGSDWHEGVSTEVMSESVDVHTSLQSGCSSIVGQSKSASFTLDLVPNAEEGMSYLWIFGYQAFLFDHEGFKHSLGTNKSREYALTAGPFQPPKCYPGWAEDIPKGELEEDEGI